MHSSASRMPRSSADQHSTFECTKCSGSPAHSQIPQSGSRPLLGGMIDQRHQEPPVVVARRMAAAVPAPGQVDELAVGVELELLRRRRSRAGPAPTCDIPRGPLDDVAPEPALPTDAVDDLEILGVAGGRAHDERAERVGLVDRAELGERAGAEARVPHPGVAVVPVAGSADRLGQRRRRRRDDRARGRVGERLEHDPRAARRGLVARAEAERRGPLAPPLERAVEQLVERVRARAPSGGPASTCSGRQ